MSDELIEAMARIIDPSSWRVMDGYLAQTLREDRGKRDDYRPDAFKHKQSMAIARALLPIIRAHLEPTSEMVDAALAKGKAANLEPPLLELMRKGLLANWRDMLAASPIGGTVPVGRLSSLANAASANITVIRFRDDDASPVVRTRTTKRRPPVKTPTSHRDGVHLASQPFDHTTNDPTSASLSPIPTPQYDCNAPNVVIYAPRRCTSATRLG